jgi:hypothetical protein
MGEPITSGSCSLQSSKFEIVKLEYKKVRCAYLEKQVSTAFCGRMFVAPYHSREIKGVLLLTIVVMLVRRPESNPT